MLPQNILVRFFFELPFYVAPFPAKPQFGAKLTDHCAPAMKEYLRFPLNVTIKAEIN